MAASDHDAVLGLIVQKGGAPLDRIAEISAGPAPRYFCCHINKDSAFRSWPGIE
jgi:hypothetical protein